MEKKEAEQVTVVGKEKREITVVLPITASGTILPPQEIHQRKIYKCHAKITFPEDWNKTHGESHWSTESPMLEYIDQVLVPYLTKKRQELKLTMDHALFDVFKAHRCDSVLEKQRHNHKFIMFSYLLDVSTGELQPLDVSVNKQFKTPTKAHFARWYATGVKEILDQELRNL